MLLIENRKENSNRYYGTYLDQIGLKQMLWVAVLPLCLALLVCTIPLGVAFGQNAPQNSNASGTNAKGSASNNGSSNSSNSSNGSNSSSSSSSSPAKSQGASAPATNNNNNNNNKAVVKVAPGSTATITTAGNKTTIIASVSSKTNTGGGGSSSSSSNKLALNKTGFTNTYILTINGKIFPIKYDINGGKLVGMLADKDRSTLVLVLNPSAKGGNMTIELPRNMIDSKGASNVDTKYQVKIDGKGVDYKEVANNLNARIVSINFSKDNRFMEIIGTTIAS
jgi:cytoskeletal protein RodZ